MFTASSISLTSFKPQNTNQSETKAQQQESTKSYHVWLHVSDLFSVKTLRGTCGSIKQLSLYLFSFVERIFLSVYSILFPNKTKHDKENVLQNHVTQEPNVPTHILYMSNNRLARYSDDSVSHLLS